MALYLQHRHKQNKPAGVRAYLLLIMTIKDLKIIIASLPDNMAVCIEIQRPHEAHHAVIMANFVNTDPDPNENCVIIGADNW